MSLRTLLFPIWNWLILDLEPTTDFEYYKTQAASLEYEFSCYFPADLFRTGLTWGQLYEMDRKKTWFETKEREKKIVIQGTTYNALLIKQGHFYRKFS